MNEYQEQESSNIIEEIDDLCKFHNKEVHIEASIQDKEGDELEFFSNLNDIKERFVQNKGSKGK